MVIDRTGALRVRSIEISFVVDAAASRKPKIKEFAFQRNYLLHYSKPGFVVQFVPCCV